MQTETQCQTHSLRQTTANNGFAQRMTTDSDGRVTFTNLPLVTIGLTAYTSDNSIAVAGVYAGDAPVTMTVISFNTPAETANYDFSNGLDGWTGSGDLFPSGQYPPLNQFNYYNPFEGGGGGDGGDGGDGEVPPPTLSEFNITILKGRHVGSPSSRALAKRDGGGQDMDLRVSGINTQTLQVCILIG